METRYATSPTEVEKYNTEQLRNEFLINNLFKENELSLTYTHYDRMIIGSAVPVSKQLILDNEPALRTNYFLERRELGIINIGQHGTVTVDGQEFALDHQDCLYVGLGNKVISFSSESEDKPARFYLVSTPAHKNYPTKKLALKDAWSESLGSIEQSNTRTLRRFVHSEGIQSCQLMLGLTTLEPGNMWNTMPAHLHDRRMEAYLYFNLPENARVFHMMGEPNKTKHIVVANEQAVISPSWSIHSGVGTSNYSFIWAMAGENYTFTDMDPVKMEDLK